MSERHEINGAASPPLETPDSPANAASPAEPAFPVCGIGASAGGLEAFRVFFGALPADTGIAFIVVQHLSPEHPSILAKTLVRFTSLPVVEIADGMPLAPGRVHVMPSNAEVLLSGNTLRLIPRAAATVGRLPIDGLFRSLAVEAHSRAIGVVLSGTGADGTLGLKEIKAEGGITFAQSPATAQFTGMPESAAAAGVVDRLLPPDDIALELSRLSHHPYVVEHQAGDRELAVLEQDGTTRILALVRQQSGVDFSVYKASTIARRIARRMALRHVGSIPEYGDLLEREPVEAKALSQDLLIHVTGFFREPEVFESLKRTVFPALLAAKREGPIRFWVPGCSTGEEVYSLAMSLLEYFDDGSRNVEFQLFGSDLSPGAIERARSGRYPEAALHELGEERLQRHFVRTGEEWRISKAIRDRCVFVVHDLARDPPFAKLDVVSCRNVLIYFGEELRQRLFPMFHYCLNRPGFLVLGRSENITGFKDLFEAVDPERRIFARSGERGRISLPVALAQRTGSLQVGTTTHFGLSRPAAEAQRQADHLLLARFAPPGVVVNERLEVIQFRGRTGELLEQPPGQPQTNLLKMVRGGLHLDLRRAIEEAKARGIGVRAEEVKVVRGDRTVTITVEVLPLLTGRDANDRYFLVIFGDAQPAPLPPPPGTGGADAAIELTGLREELAATKLYLEAVAEQHQTSDDEFATVNEELIAANEELQSTNEELESAKEELQSANEELTTLNDELRGRNSELDRLADDLSNILAAVDIPIVIVDAARKVRRFTPDARALLSLIPSDLGRPIDDIKLNVDVPDLDRRIAGVMRRAELAEWEVQDPNGHWFRMQIRPYRAGERGLDGAILSFVDVNDLKQAVRAAQGMRDYARAIVETVQVPLLVVDSLCQVVSANPSFARDLGGGIPARAGDDPFAPSLGISNVEVLRRAIIDVLAGRNPPPGVVVRSDVPGLPQRTFAVTVRRVDWPAGKAMALLAFEDLTEQQRLEEERTARAVAEASNRTKDLFLATLSHELRTPLTTVLMNAQALRRTGQEDPKVIRASAAIERAANLQKRLIDDLLDVSRIISGKLGLDQHIVDLAAVVEGAVEEARPASEAKGVALHVAVAPGSTAVYADPARMQQVVSNLLTNAIKFTPGGGEISVTLERGTGQARVAVRDTGMGVRREFLPHLFNRFSQADSSATRLHGGLGLGLAIVKHLVDLHGGAVGADSLGTGQGATFWVTLPLASAPAPEHAPSRPPRLAASVAGLRVLLVEDDEGTRESLVEILSEAGASVRASASVAEALEALPAFRPDVLLSDLAMPGRDGFSLIAELRARPPEHGGDIPAAAVSALAGVEDQRRALAAGFQMHIPKPVDIDGLLSAVARLATLRRTGRPASQ